MLSNQEIFDKVKSHLLMQGKRAENGSMCLYRAPGGLKCAVGCLISDEEYSPEMEELTLLSIVKKLDLGDLGFLRQLQEIHDFDRVDDWKVSLDYFARHHGLNP